jgi:hypothetical protein
MLRETVGTSFEATVLPATMESGGLTAPEDFKKFDRIDALNKEGRHKEVSSGLRRL